MANGDVTYTDVEGFIKLGRAFPETSSTTMTQDDAANICSDINAEVNLILKRLGFALPMTDADSIRWVRLTKLNGAACYTIDGLMAQDSEEGVTRAERYCERYQARLNQLVNSGGEILDADKQTDPRPTSSPLLVGGDEQDKRYLRFPQRSRADEYDNKQGIEDSGAPWVDYIRGF